MSSILKVGFVCKIYYREWQARLEGTSWKAKIESNIERALSNSDTTTSFANFRASLQGLGVEIDESGKYLKYCIERTRKYKQYK